jgi:cysteine sulfinate desulfinase/cysteine desulfurase-like protein
MPSHVLQAIGADAPSTLRLTVGRFNTEEEIEHAIGHLRAKLEECQARRAVTPA